MQSSDQAISALSPEQRGHVDALLDELLDLPETERFASLRGRGIQDTSVAREVESLLRAASASTDFLSKTPRRRADDALQHAPVGTRLGVWRIVRLIGHGGMGDVYEATRAQGDFEHRVAIKLLRREAVAQLKRFEAERQILARLEHPCIARLYDGGITDDERPYMVMEYVEGLSITDYCAQKRASLQERLALFIQVCAAVTYAHQNLIVHRDLKASNILVTTTGTVKLLDFGIAKLLDAQSARMTHAAGAPLTPICAAPEQLTGAPVTTATDVYALGLLLFELLTGTHPWIGTDTPILLALRTALQRPAPVASGVAMVTANAPVLPRLIRGDLDAIVAKALRNEPAHRYATVDSLKLEIDRLLAGEPIEARKGARLYIVGRILRRYRWAATAIVVLIASALSVIAWQARQVSIEREAARRAGSREEAMRYNLTRLFRDGMAERAIDSGAVRAVRELHDQPELAGQMVLAPADVHGSLEDATGAASLLEGFVAESNPQVDPAALADARQKLADIELLRDQFDYAAQLLDQADAFWASSPRPYLEERLEGLVVRARLQRARGEFVRAIATIEQAIARRVELSGREHRETASLYNSLAIALTSAGRQAEALAAYHVSTAIYGAIGLGDGLDAQIVMANNGILELGMGHLKVAEVLLKSAAKRERSIAGDSAALAAAMGYYGEVLCITNRNEPAVAVLREAVHVAARHAGPDSPLALQNRLFLSEAEAAVGNRNEASAMLNDVRVAAIAQYGAAHPLALRTQIALAQLAVSGGEQARARIQLLSIIATLRKLGVPGESQLAHALEILGDLQLQSGQAQEANATLQEAVALRERTSGASWELARARERLGETLERSGSEAAAGLLEQASRDLESQLGANHPETLRAKAALAAAPVGRTGS